MNDGIAGERMKSIFLSLRSLSLCVAILLDFPRARKYGRSLALGLNGLNLKTAPPGRYAGGLKEQEEDPI
jgi:hypothetical protein